MWDVNGHDLCGGALSLDRFRGVAFVGGFSYADVLGSAKGRMSPNYMSRVGWRRYQSLQVQIAFRHQRAVLLTVGRSYVGNYVTHSMLLDRACACSYDNLPKYRSYRVSNTAPWSRFHEALRLTKAALSD